MSIFGRRRSGSAPADGDALTTTAADDGAPAGAATAGRTGGPWDVGEVEGRGSRVDLGALWLPGRDGMQLRMEVDKRSGTVTAAAVNLGGSVLQLQVFAAPRSEGIWDEIREEIAASVTKQGGTADDLPGPFGREVLARLPVRTPEGRTGHRPARFVGVDGPRWFLRGVLSGRAAVEPDAAAELEAVFADCVVVRGPEPRVPRELLPLTVPGARPAPAAPAAPTIDPLARGPEITEIG